MTHTCPTTGCTITVPANTFMCARHWRMVPRPLRDAIYADFARTGRAGANHREALRLVNATEGGRADLGLPAGTKALTIWQPWASLVMIGAKRYEFRRWNFADKPHLAKLVGKRLVVHAGARPPRVAEIDDILNRIVSGESELDQGIAVPFLTDLRAKLAAIKLGQAAYAIPLAAALGSAVLEDPRSVADLFADQVADSDRLDHHMYAWPLADVRPFPAPVAAAGAQGFWNWS